MHACCIGATEAGSVTGGSLTAADVLVAAGGDFKVDKLTGLRMDIAQGGVPGGRVRIGAAYCDKQLHLECRGAPLKDLNGSLYVESAPQPQWWAAGRISAAPASAISSCTSSARGCLDA